MNSDSHARIEHEIAELRGAYPRLTTCHSALRNWTEEGVPRHSLWLDLRWPEHQSIVSGPACASAEEAVQAAFDKARGILSADGPRRPRAPAR
jgi:hypothetical protein